MRVRPVVVMLVSVLLLLGVLLLALAPQVQAGGCVSRYTVQPGDTLSAIAWRLGTTVIELARLNRLRNPNLIRIGQTLCLPAEARMETPTPPVPTTSPAVTPTVTLTAPQPGPTTQPTTPVSPMPPTLAADDRPGSRLCFHAYRRRGLIQTGASQEAGETSCVPAGWTAARCDRYRYA